MIEHEYEILEDDIRNFLEDKRIDADIFDSATGNDTTTRRDKEI